MVSKRVRIASVAIGLTAFLVSGAAFAQAAKESAEKGGDGYGYEFDDDPLSAGGFGPNDATIRVRPRAARTTLIRPRIQFVDEMLKSVENL
jgi:hypothetical protein